MGMTYKERIERERTNTEYMYMYSDGSLFYQLYDRSAYAFCTRIKDCKVFVRPLKALPEPYLRTGFPVSQREKYLHEYDISTDDDGRTLAVRLHAPIVVEEYQQWRDNIIENFREKEQIRQKDGSGNNAIDTVGEPNSDTTSPSMSTPTATRKPDADSIISGREDSEYDCQLRECLDEVLRLNIASMTPMETMIFLNDFQTRLRQLKVRDRNINKDNNDESQ